MMQVETTATPSAPQHWAKLPDGCTKTYVTMDVSQAGRKQRKDYFLVKELGAGSEVRELGFPK